MATKIIIKQGLDAQLPTLAEGEFGFCTDSKLLFIGGDDGNVQLAKESEITALQSAVDLKASASDVATSVSDLNASIAALLPPGMITPFAGASAPTGWLLCQGQSLLRASYPALFTAIGTTYGTADGTHFNLPDTSGVFLRAAGSQTISSRNYSATLGAKQIDATAKNGLYDSGHTHTFPVSNSAIGGGAPNVSYAYPAGVQQYNSTGGTAANLASTDTETRPANITVNYIIKT